MTWKGKSWFAMPATAVIVACLFVASSASAAIAQGGAITRKRQSALPTLRKDIMAGLPSSATVKVAAHAAAVAAAAAPLTLPASGDDTTRHPDDVKTSSREEMTTSPPPEAPKSATSVLLTIGKSIQEQLRNPKGQWINALVAFIFGLVMIVDGEFVFKWLVVGGVFILASILTYNESAALLGFEDKNLVRFVVLEVGVCSAFAAHRGIEGMMITVGAILGALVAQEAQNLCVGVGWTSLQTNKWCEVILYSLFVLSFMALITLKKHKKMLALLSSAGGGALVASATAWLVTVMALHGYLDTVLYVFKKSLKPAGGAWLDFLELLWTPKSEDKGVFAGSAYNFTIFDTSYRLDRICGCTLWTILFWGGSFIQLKRLQKLDKSGKVKPAAPKGKVKPAAPKASALQQPLIQSEQ